MSLSTILNTWVAHFIKMLGVRFRHVFSFPKPYLNPWLHKHMNHFCLLGSCEVTHFVTAGTNILGWFILENGFVRNAC